MAVAIVSAVAQRLVAIIEEQIQNEANLVRGVDKAVLDLSDALKRVTNLLEDAVQNKRRKGFQNKRIKHWLKRLEDACYEMDDVLDEWSLSLIKFQMEQRHGQTVFPLIPCLCFTKDATRHDIAIKIKTVKAKLDVILEEKDWYNFGKDHSGHDELRRVTTSLVDVEEVKGRGCDKDILVKKIIEKDKGINVASIVGTGGIGKTTLAQLVYNDDRVKDCFSLRIWICVSDPFDQAKIAKEIVEQVQKTSPRTNQLEMLLRLVMESVSGKKFLLVLDDVWTDNPKWWPLKTSLKYGAGGSSVLVTTRNEKVAMRMGTTEDGMYRLGQLSEEDCWLLFHRMAFHGRRSDEMFQELLDIGRKITHKCKGLPLAAKVLGSLLRYKNTVEAWEAVLNSEIWQLKEAELDLFSHLVLSCNDLSPTLERCFSYCAVFPKNHKIDVDKLIRNWMALGYLSSNGNLEGDLELRGREYFDNLVTRSLFQDLEKDLFGRVIGCKMHDIVHDFAQFLRESDRLESSNGIVESVVLKSTNTCQVCDPQLVSRIKEYCSLFVQRKKCYLHICDCLISLRVLSLVQCGLQSIPVEIEKLIHLRDLNVSRNKFSVGDLKSICKIYNLQTLLLCWCHLVEIPTEIGNLVQLRHLDLSSNVHLKKLPESICGLHELRILNINLCRSLSVLPQGIHNLINLKALNNYSTESLKQYPRELAQLTGLQILNEVDGGSLGILKNLNRLSRYISLNIRLANLDEAMVADAQEAEFVKKIHLHHLYINFLDQSCQKEEDPLCMDVLDALRPHTNLHELWIVRFKGSKLPSWIGSPHYHLRRIVLDRFEYCFRLPPFGQLPCLEELYIMVMSKLEFVGREFLGITSSSSISSVLIGFPKLKELTLDYCPRLKEWEDITVEEEESSVMPCLTKLVLSGCPVLTELPYRLLRKASSMELLILESSDHLTNRYEDKKDPFRKLICHIPQVQCSS